MGKPTDPDRSQPTDDLSLHTDPGNSFPAYHDDEDAPELNVDSLNDLPPLYSDAAASSSSAALAPLPADPPSPYGYAWKDANTGAERYVNKFLEQPSELENHIRYLSTLPPRPYIKIRGTHQETRRKSDGKSERVTVTDFDVSVDMTPYLYSDAQYRRSWKQIRVVEDWENTRRGTIFKKRAPSLGHNLEGGGDPKPTLEEWCHRFCASHAGLKAFAMKRQMTGFDFPEVKEHLTVLVRQTNYRGHLTIEMVTKDEFVEVLNDTRINRWRLMPWVWWICALTLMFIFTWPYLWLRTKRWEVVVAEWPFSRVTDTGSREYVSLSEEQWYNMWARAIASAVLEKRQAVLDQSDLRRAEEPQPNFESGNAAVDAGVSLFRAGLSAMNEVNRQLGWGGDC